MITTSQTTLGKEALISTTSLPPPYDPKETELERLSTYASDTSLPQYEIASPSSSSSASFVSTLSYQIDNRGLPWMALPLAPKPHPIPIYAITSDGQVGEKVYESIRPLRSSGNCVLYDATSNTPLVTTTYRFGPGRPPKVRLLAPNATIDLEHLTEQTTAGGDEFEVIPLGCATRSVSMRTSLGTFHWRHGSKAEKKALRADSVLIFEHITTLAVAGGKIQQQPRKVAHFIRNEELRTEGSGKTTAGNGGRLEMDLREWMDGKGERETMERVVVTGVVCMLKREVDRRRMHQTAIIAGGAGGGGGG